MTRDKSVTTLLGIKSTAVYNDVTGSTVITKDVADETQTKTELESPASAYYELVGSEFKCGPIFVFPSAADDPTGVSEYGAYIKTGTHTLRLYYDGSWHDYGGGGGGMEVHDIAGEYHTSTATSGQILKANASGLPVDASNTDAQVASAVSASHSNANDPSADEKAALAGTSGIPSGTNKYVTNADSRNADARTPVQHAIDSATLHGIGSLTNTYLVKSDGTKLVPATNTDAQVAAAVSASHAAVSIDGTSPLSLSTQAISLKNSAAAAITAVSTDGTLADNSDTKVATQKAVKTYADTKVAQTITNGVTTSAPSEDAVFDALALKSSTSHKATHEIGGGDAISARINDLQPYCKVRKDAVQSIPNNTGTEMLWNTEVSDLLGMHSTVTNTGRITIPAGCGGLYVIKCRVTFSSHNTGLRQMYVLVNGGHIDTWGENDTCVPTPGDIATMKIDVTTILAANDYVQIYVLQNSGGALDTLAFYNWFSVTRIAGGAATA